MTLLEKKLVDFNDNFSFDITLEVLNEKFEELAKYFLYSGYIQVNDSYRIELVSVEFYFHAEEKNDSTCKYFQDPIVYHRNGRFGLTDVPYLPMIKPVPAQKKYHPYSLGDVAPMLQVAHFKPPISTYS